MVLYPRDHKPADHLQYTLMSFSPGFPKIVVNVYYLQGCPQSWHAAVQKFVFGQVGRQ